MSAFISIIIPVYNAEKYLEKCVSSISSSDVFSELEIILVNDGSPDDSALICDRLGSGNTNIKVIHQANEGVSSARNCGLQAATGEYITFCDSDDYYINDILKKAAAVLKSESPDLLIYDFLYEQSDGVSRISYPFVQNKNEKNPSAVFKYMLRNENLNSSCNKFFKRSIIKQGGVAFEHGQKHGEDRDFVLTYLTMAKSFYYLPVDGYFYRFVKTGAVNKARTDYFDNIFHEYLFKRKISASFGDNEREARILIKEKAIEQIVSATFAASENSFTVFRISLKKLFNNKDLMLLLTAKDRKKFQNPAYEKVYNCLKAKNILGCRMVIGYLKFKEKIYKIIH